MPSVLTHHFFNLTSGIIYKDKDLKDLQKLGAQGPDPFFFYGVTHPFWKNKKTVTGFGSFLHHIDPAQTFIFFLEKALGDPENKEVILAYLQGIVNHYVLDRNCHPFVFYKTGFGSKYSMFDHQRFESNIDVHFYQASKTTPTKAIHANVKQVEIISHVYFELAQKLEYSGIEKDSFLKSYKQMLTTEAVLFSRLGIKKFFVNLFLKHTSINAMCKPLNFEGKIDYLNDKKTEWRHPANLAIFNFSFLELVERAQNELKIIQELIVRASNGEDVQKDIYKFTNELNHDGNLLSEKFVEYNSVYFH